MICKKGEHISGEKKIEYWSLDKFKPYPKNSRTHSAEQINQIAASISEFGFTNPILVDAAAGIVAGHGRLMAAQKLGMKKVPVIVLTGLTDHQRREWIRLGSFPDDYQVKTARDGKYLIGMSVPPKMTEAVARAVCNQWLKVQ